MISKFGKLLCFDLILISSVILISNCLSNTPRVLAQVPPRNEPPSTQPLREPTIPVLPPPEQLLEPLPTPTPETPPPQTPEMIIIHQFEVVGSSILSPEQVAELTKSYVDRPLSVAELFEVRGLINQYYQERGYVTTGSLIPPQNISSGVLTIQVIEGGIEDIEITGTQRLNPSYVRSRIAVATKKPLNVNRLREALQMLQLDPLIASISTELSAGTQTGLNILKVQVLEAPTFESNTSANNNRSASVGSLSRGFGFTEANLFGLGDSLTANYTNSDGSYGYDASYTIPINPRNGTLRLSTGSTSSNVIDPVFDILNIRSRSAYYEVSLRQPLRQTPVEELAIGLTFSRQTSTTTLLDIPFPLSTGADDNGRTIASALRFFQEYTKRSPRSVLSARSQFSFGVNWWNSTRNSSPPDSGFFSWRGQAQWVRLLGPDTLFVLRGDIQIADRTLLGLEQFGLGGQETVRGYRQNYLLSDNGALASLEARIPILRLPGIESILQLTPFVDLGWSWNTDPKNELSQNFLAGVGLGLRWQMSDRLSLRLDWGIPLNGNTADGKSWQEDGFYFSVNFNPF